MLRATSVFIGLALLAGSAQAQDYKISLQNKSSAQIQFEIHQAATKACNEAYADNMDPMFDYDYCVTESIRLARAQLQSKAVASLDGKPVRLASR